MKPRIPITDKRFEYVPAAKTDLGKRFKEEKERIEREKKHQDNRIVRIGRGS